MLKRERRMILQLMRWLSPFKSGLAVKHSIIHVYISVAYSYNASILTLKYSLYSQSLLCMNELLFKGVLDMLVKLIHFPMLMHHIHTNVSSHFKTLVVIQVALVLCDGSSLDNIFY